MKESIILIGGGGHCHSCIDVIEQTGKYQIAGIVDVKEKVGSKVLGYEVIGTDEDIPRLVEQHRNALITVGQIKSSSVREKIAASLKEAGASLPVIISPLAYVSRHAQIGAGTVVMHHAIVNAACRVGENCILNTKSLCEHDVVIGNFCHISTGAIINGHTMVKARSFIGSNAVIRQSRRLGIGTIIPYGERQ